MHFGDPRNKMAFVGPHTKIRHSHVKNHIIKTPLANMVFSNPTYTVFCIDLHNFIQNLTHTYQKWPIFGPLVQKFGQIWQKIGRPHTKLAVPLVIIFFENIDFQRRYDAFSDVYTKGNPLNFVKNVLDSIVCNHLTSIVLLFIIFAITSKKKMFVFFVFIYIAVTAKRKSNRI